CDRLVTTLVGSEPADDVALLALRPADLAVTRLSLQMPARPDVLAPLRRTLRRWLRNTVTDPVVAYGIVVACGEACTNAVQHPYGGRDGVLDVEFSLIGDEVRIAVRDTGSWRPQGTSDGGRGMSLIESLMDTVEVETGPDGSVVRMRRRIEASTSDDAARTH